MRKIKILVSSEASFLNTGYGKYALELMHGLRANPEYEVAEFAAYGTYDPANHMYAESIHSVPWKVYCNRPDQNNADELRNFESNPLNEFGRFKFESVCLDFKPDVVLSFRDYWMDCHIDVSPLRRYFRWIHMPTIDAEPQKTEWLDCYKRADVLLTYSDWAIESLARQKFAGNVFRSAPPAGTVELEGIDREAERKRLGIPADAFVVGTVMRNQPRKLYDILFSAFEQFSADKPEAILYCHTGYPDVGWNLPELAVRNNVANKILFTYTCQTCKHHYAAYFNQALTYCPKCGAHSATLANTKRGVTHEEVSRIISTFDVYAQIANSEGFGLPQVEAAAVGVPVIATDYSAMADVVRKLNGFPVSCFTTTEVESGCERAIPFISSILEGLEEVYKAVDLGVWQDLSMHTYEGYKEHYSWDRAVATWDEAIKKVYTNSLWNLSPIMCNIPDGDPPKFDSALDFLRYCYIDILKRPDLLYSYDGQQTLMSLTSGFTQNGREVRRTTPKEVYDRIINRARFINFWENRRAG